MSLLIDPYRFGGGGGGSSYEDEVLADSPYLLWPLTETSGTTAADASGNGRTGTYVGPPTLAGASGYPDASSVPIFGSGKYVQSAANVVLGSTFTIEAWFNKDAYLAGQDADINSILGDLTSVSNGWLARWNGNTTTLTTYIPNGGSYSTLTCTTPEDTLHHYVFKSDGTTCKIRLNGSEVASGTITPAGFNMPFRVARSEVGRYTSSSAGWLAIYDTNLSDARCDAHFAAA